MRIATACPGRHLIPLGLLILAGCAAGPSAPFSAKGTSGSIAWEITDVGQLTSPDGQRMRWSYVIILRETAGESVAFEQVARTLRTTIEMVGGSGDSRPFSYTLAPRGELRYSTTDGWGWMPESARAFGGATTMPPLTVERRFIGRADGGRPVDVTTRIHLDRSVGKRVAPTVPTTGTLPPSKTLHEPELAGLSGRWEGSFRADWDVFDVPTTFEIEKDGSVRVATNDPVTNRFRAALSIRDGQLLYVGTSETGKFTLHEREGLRLLSGYVSAPRESSQTPIGYTIRLRWQSP